MTSRVYVDNAVGDRAYGTVVARRDKTRMVYVVVDDNPKADDWYPLSLWTKEDDDA